MQVGRIIVGSGHPPYSDKIMTFAVVHLDMSQVRK